MSFVERSRTFPVSVNWDWSKFGYPIGKGHVEFYGVTGTVFGISGQAVTHVSSGNYAVYSTTNRYKDFFIRRDDTGADQAFQFANLNVPLSEGQRVTILGAGVGGPTVWWSTLVHHETEQVYHLRESGDLAVKLNLAMSSRASAATAFFLSGLMFVVLLVGSLFSYSWIAPLLPPKSKLPFGVTVWLSQESLLSWLTALVLGGPVVVFLVSLLRAESRHGKARLRVDQLAREISHQILTYVVQAKRGHVR